MYQNNFTNCTNYVIIMSEEKMVKREQYLKKIRGFYNETSLIKVIYGLRRSGKSVLLTQIIDEIKKNNVKEDHIIYINFESLDYLFIKNAKDLDKYLKEQVKDNDIYYIFLDEIQNVENFEKGINSLRITGNFSIFITGSNSRLTFVELSSVLSGRYVSFKVNPLSFKESVSITDTKKDNYETLLYDIFEKGSLPQRFLFKNENDVINYITDVYNSIVLKDVIERIGIKDVTSFNKILQYLLNTEGKEFSALNIQEYLKKEGNEISSQTLYTYLDTLCSVFIINKVYRYDIKGKSILKTLNKYYVSDLGIKRIKTTSEDTNYSILFESLVYNELINKGYEVFVGKTNNGEIDFVAKKDKQIKYVQVSLYLSSLDTIKREFGAFDSIKDNYPKYIISLDKENLSKNGIIHINAFKFFMDDDF